MCEPISCLCLACCGVCCCVWGMRRCCASSVDVSSSSEWRLATREEFEDVPRICRVILAAYETDLEDREYADKLLTGDFVKKTSYKENKGMCPPYVIYLDHDAKDISVGIRGLNMASLPDYKVLMDHKKGFSMTEFDGGYVHHGLLRSAQWLLETEFGTLSKLAAEHPEYTVTFAGHSLGSGVVALMAMLVCNDPDKTMNITRDRLRCYAIAPSRSASMSLAVKYADVISSIILQDDFLPRTPAPIEVILSASFCLPCLLCWKCASQTCVSESARLKDPKRLYAPGRLYHVLYKKDFSCTNDDPVVKTAVEVKKRFEHIIFSRTTVDDHSIVIIEQKSTAAVDGMTLPVEEDKAETQAPEAQKMMRMETMRKQQLEEVADAAEQSQALGVPNAPDPTQFASEAASLSQELDQQLEGSEARREAASQSAVEGRPLESGQEGAGLVVEDQDASSLRGKDWEQQQRDKNHAARRWHKAAEKISQQGAGSKWAALVESLTGKEEQANERSVELIGPEPSTGPPNVFVRMLSTKLTGV